ncbi:component of the polarisome [Ascosphaera aggregata]|nr:component of the polarisome [Ascosphaera aggregata]
MKAQNSSTRDDGDIRTRYETLEREHQALKAELKEQQEVTEQVRQQAQAFLVEMRQLSEEGGGNLEREESLNTEIQRLSEEVQLWKDRYAKTRTRLRGLRSSTLGLPGMEYNISLFKENDLLSPEGMVKDVHVTKFQMAIDELLRSARMGEPQVVLNKVKNVVTSVRGLNQDLEVVNANLSSREQGSLSHSPPSSSTLSGLPAPIRKLKARVATTANNLITATKNYSRSHGLSPVSLLDAAASHLCSAVVELVRAVKVRPTPIDELADDEDEKGSQSPGMFSVAQSQVTGAMFSAGDGESIYSDLETPGRGSGAATGNMGDMAANVSRLLNEHQKAENEKEGKSTNRKQNDSDKSDHATSPQSLPSSSHQNMGNQVQHSQGKYSTKMSNPPPRMQSPKIDEQDEELEDLRMYIDDQTVNFLKSTEALVKNVRATTSTQSSTTAKSPEHKYHPSAVREHLDTITAIVEHVSIATEQILTSPTAAPANMKLRQELHRQVTPIVEQLSREREDLLLVIEKISSSSSFSSSSSSSHAETDGSTRGQMLQRVEQLAYLLGRDMKCLVSGLDPQIDDAAGANGVQPAKQQQQQHQSRSKNRGAGHVQDHSDAPVASACNGGDLPGHGAGEVASVASVAQVGTPYKARRTSKQGQ